MPKIANGIKLVAHVNGMKFEKHWPTENETIVMEGFKHGREAIDDYVQPALFDAAEAEKKAQSKRSGSS